MYNFALWFAIFALNSVYASNYYGGLQLENKQTSGNLLHKDILETKKGQKYVFQPAGGADVWTNIANKYKGPKDLPKDTLYKHLDGAFFAKFDAVTKEVLATHYYVRESTPNYNIYIDDKLSHEGSISAQGTDVTVIPNYELALYNFYMFTLNGYEYGKKKKDPYPYLYSYTQTSNDCYMAAINSLLQANAFNHHTFNHELKRQFDTKVKAKKEAMKHVNFNLKAYIKSEQERYEIKSKIGQPGYSLKAGPNGNGNYEQISAALKHQFNVDVTQMGNTNKRVWSEIDKHGNYVGSDPKKKVLKPLKMPELPDERTTLQYMEQKKVIGYMVQLSFFNLEAYDAKHRDGKKDKKNSLPWLHWMTIKYMNGKGWYIFDGGHDMPTQGQQHYAHTKNAAGPFDNFEQALNHRWEYYLDWKNAMFPPVQVWVYECTVNDARPKVPVIKTNSQEYYYIDHFNLYYLTVIISGIMGICVVVASCIAYISGIVCSYGIFKMMEANNCNNRNKPKDNVIDHV